MALLEFRDVSYSIGAREIVRKINLSVEEGETVVLLGRSGSGKTTLIKCVNRLTEPTSGEIWYEGKPLRDWDRIRLRRTTGYVIQENGLLPHLTVEENVATVPRLENWAKADIEARVAVVLNAVGLSPLTFGTRLPRQLSGGQRQRVGIARAFAANPPLLLMDEPFGALDPVTRFELQKMFQALSREFNKTTLFVTHDIREALMLGSRIALLRDGEIDSVSLPREFLQARSEEARMFLATLESDRREP